MSPTTRSVLQRTAVTTAVGLVSLLLGIVGARAFDGSDTQAIGMTDLDRGFVASDSVRPSDEGLIPILAPEIEVAPDDAVVLPDGVTDGSGVRSEPATSVGQMRGTVDPIPQSVIDADEPTLDEDTADGAEEAPTEPVTGAGPPAGIHLPALRLFVEQQPEAVDPCAGPGPGDETPVSCPPGVGSTMLAGTGPSKPVGAIVDGHLPAGESVGHCPPALAAPAEGSTGVTFVTSAPLVAAEVLSRPVELIQPDLAGPVPPWIPLSLPNPAHDGYASRWAAVAADTGDAPATAFCFDLQRDPSTPYEITATVTDVFGTTYVLPETILASQDPDARPLTTVSREGNLVTVSAWSVEGADVVFRVTPVRAGNDHPACDGTLASDPWQLSFSEVGNGFGSVFTARNQVPTPIGIADPDFTWRHDATFGVFAGTDAIVCITILNSDNPFDVLVEERLVIGSYGAWLPSVGMWAGSVRVPDGMSISFPGACGDAIVLRRAQVGGLWRCDYWDLDRPFAIDAGHDHPVAMRFEDWSDGPPERDDVFVGAPVVHPRVCADECEAPTQHELFFRVIIDDDNEVHFTTSYHWRDGTLRFGGPTWRFVAESDAAPVERTEFESDSSFVTDVLTGQVSADITFFSTVSTTLIGASLTILEPGFDGVTPCGVEGPIEVGEGPAGLEHTLSLGDLCPGTFYAVTAEFRVGSEVATSQHFFTTPHLLGAYDMTVEFLTDAHRSLEISDVQIVVEEHQRPFVLDGFGIIDPQTNRMSPGRVPDRACQPVGGGSATFLSYSGEAMFEGRSIAYLEARGPSLDISLTFRNPSVGTGHSCGDPSPHPGPYTVTGSIPVSSLNGVGQDGLPSAGTFVIERTVADGLAVRVTLRPIGAVWASRE